MATAEDVGFRRPSGLTVRTDIDHSLSHHPKLARAFSILVRRTHGLPIMRGTIATRRFPLALDFERIGASSDNIARQRTPVVGSLNDKQRRDGLFDSSTR